MDYSNFEDWEINTLAERNGQTADEWKAEQDALAGKETVPEATTPPTEPEKNNMAAGDSSSADISLESSETDPPAKTETEPPAGEEIKQPELTLDELDARINEPRYVEFENGHKVYEDQYQDRIAGTKRGRFPETFEEYAKEQELEIKYGETRTFYSPEGSMLDEVEVIAGQTPEENVNRNLLLAPFRSALRAYRGIKKEHRLAKAGDEYLKAIAGQNKHTNKQEILLTYFGLTEMERFDGNDFVISPYTHQDLARSIGGGREEGESTLVLDEEAYREILGPKKFQQWLDLNGGVFKLNVTQEALDNFNVDDVQDGTIQKVVSRNKTLAAEGFVREMGVEDAREMMRYLESPTSFDEFIVAEMGRRERDAKDFKEKFGYELRYDQTIQGRTYIAPNSQRVTKGRGFDEQFLLALEKYDADLKEFEVLAELYDEQYTFLESTSQNYEKRLKDIQQELEAFTVNGKPVIESEWEARKYNSLIEQYNSLLEEEQYVSLTANIEKLEAIRLSLKEKSDDLDAQAPLFGDLSIANDAPMKMYGLLARMDQAIDEAFIGAPIMLAAHIVDWISRLDFSDSQAFRKDGAEFLEWASDYNAKIAKGREDLALKITAADLGKGIKGVDGGAMAVQIVADNSPSIIVTTATMGVGAMPVAGLTTAQMARFSANLAGTIFFGMEAGGYLSEMSLGKRYANQQKAELEKELKQLRLDGYSGSSREREILEEIEYNDNYLKISELQLGFSAFAYGGIAGLFERTTQLGFIKNYQKYSRAVGYETFSKYLSPYWAQRMSTTLTIPRTVIGGATMNLIEEGGTQIGQNFVDVHVGGFKKSYLDGLDTDFVLNTLGQGLAISGPQIGMNLYSGVANIFTNRAHMQKMNGYREKLLSIQADLQTDKLTKEQRIKLRAERRVVLSEMNLAQTDILLKLPDMDAADVNALISIDRDLNSIYQQAAELGQQGEVGSYGKRQLETLKEQSIQLEAKKEEILGKSDAEILIKYKDAANPAQAVFNHNLFRRSLRLAQVNNDFNLAEIRSMEDLQRFFNNNPEISQDKKAAITRAFMGEIDANGNQVRGVNAMEVDGKIIVFSEFIEDQIGLLDDLNATIAAVSPLHELGHIKTRQAGVLNDSDILEKAAGITSEVRTALESKLAAGKISQDDFDIAMDRLNYYEQNSSNDLVNVDEAFQLVADLINTGAIDKNSFTSLYNFKSFTARTVSKLFGELKWTMQLNNASDVFNFVSSWATKVAAGKKIITSEEKETAVKESVARGDLLQTINDLVPETVQTQADFFDRKVFNPIYNDGNLHPAISNYIRNKAVSAEEAQKIIDSVADRLINFNPEAQRKSGEGKITLGEFIFSNVNFGQRDARKALFEESQERAQVESTDSEQARQIAVAEESTSQVEKPKYKSLAQRKVLSEEAMGPARQKALSIVRVLKSPIDAEVSKNVTVTPLAAEIKKAMGKQLDIDFKKEMGGLKDGQLRKYLLKNKAAILENMTTTWLMTAMPNAVQKQVNGVWTSDWKGKKVDREKTSTDNAGRTSGAEMVRRLPKAATRLSDAEFLSNFFTEDGKLIRGRKESLAKAMAEETGFEIIREALNDPNSEIAQAFLAAQERAGAKDLTNIGVKFDVMAERGNVKFSVALGKKLQNIGKGIRSEFDMQLPKNRDKMINKVLAIHGIDPVYKLNTKEDIIAWKEATQKYVLPLLPKWYWFTKKNGEYADSGNSAFRRSARFVGDRSLDGFFIEQINELRALDENSGAFGTVDGISERMTGTYETKLGKTEEQFRENYENGDINAFNEYNTKMHAAFWANVNKVIRESNFNPDAVRAIGHYLTLVSNDTSHVHKMGAEFVGYTANAKGKTSSNGTFKLYEMEHAMPATNAYSYLMDAVLNGYDFDAAYNAVMSNYKLIALDAADDLKLKAAGLSNGMPDGWSVLDNGWHERYSSAGVDLSTIIMNNGQTLAEIAGVNKFGEPMSQNGIEFNKKVDQQALADTKEAMEPSVRFSRATPRAVFMVGGPGAGKTNVGKGLKLGRRGFKVINQDLALEPMKIEAGLPANEQQYTREQRSMRAKLGAAARKAAEAKMAKYMGFGESMVVDGTGASYNATMKKINALRDAGYEVSIVFANTSKEEAVARNKARAERALPDNIVERTWDAVQESAKLYKQEFGDKFYEINTNELKLGQSLPTEFLNKLYKDLDATGIRYSNALSKKFNEIIERKTGVEAVKNFSRIQAQMRGRNKGRFKFFIAPGADDFRGLVHYAFAGKGKQGEADMAWFEEKLMTPYFKGVSAIDAMRQQIKRDFRVVTKQFKQEYKMLKKKIGKGMFTYDHALRVYMWDRQGLEVEGLSKRDKKLLLDAIAKNPELVSLADALLVVARRDEWPDPAAHWEAGSVLSDLNGMTEKIGRKKFLQEFIENAEVIFSEENLNKIEAIYGRRHREAIEDSLYAMKNGTNRPTGSNRQVNAWLNWINGSTGAIMFFNRRSALLQMLSFTNFINWSDNNMVKAAAAFANQKQYWSDWTMIFNSDKLKERRGGLKQDVSESEIAAVAGQSKNSPKAILAYLLKIGFTPTQIADSMAIATGGAMFYRNRVNTYLKQGMDQKAAEEQAFLDFSMKSDEAQQSSDPALVSQQQRSVLGRLILAFANTPMQYTRLMKKAGQDLINGRGRPIENISKIAYYGIIQNFIFSALQSALFAMAFDDDDEELSEAEVERKAAKEEQKVTRVFNSMLDTVLRGSGVYGAVASTMKNAIMEYYKQEEKGFMGDHTYTLLAAAGISPPIQSKFRKIYSAIQTSRFEKDNVEARGWALTADGRLNLGPNWSIFGNVLSGVTNVPLDRVVDELKSVSEALDERNQAWQRIALALGWKTWDVGVRNEEADLIKTEAKEARKQEGIRKAKETRRINTEAKKKKEAEEAQAAFEAWEKEFIKNQRKNEEN